MLLAAISCLVIAIKSFSLSLFIFVALGLLWAREHEKLIALTTNLTNSSNPHLIISTLSCGTAAHTMKSTTGSMMIIPDPHGRSLRMVTLTQIG